MTTRANSKLPMTILIGCLGVCFAGTVGATEVKSDFSSREAVMSLLEFGKHAPKIIPATGGSKGSFLSFSSTASDASAAAIKNFSLKIDQGVFFHVRFKASASASNPFPRIIDQENSISLHMVSADHSLKLLLRGSNDQYAQVIFPDISVDEWHEVRAAFDPVNKEIYLQVDGSEIYDQEVSFPLNVKPNAPVILGADALAESDRGFNGLIGDFRIVSPYRLVKKDFPRPLSTSTRPTDDTANIRHIKICAINNRHLAFPGVTKLPNGNLAVVFREGESHICPYGRICLTYSRDMGQSWSAPICVSDTPSDERDPSIQTLPDGRVLITHSGWNSWMSIKQLRDRYASESKYIEESGPEKFGGYRYLFSNDGGLTWERPFKVEAFCPHGPFFYQEHLYSPSMRTEGETRYVDFWMADKNAQNWKRLSTIATSTSVYEKGPVYEEPHSIVRKDGVFVTVIRVPNEGHMLISFSEDQGKSWSTPIKTPIKGFPQHLLQLKDGRLLVTYGYRYYPDGIRACISRDGGKTWDIDKEIVICWNGKDGDLGYPVSIELDHGEVFTVYYYKTRIHPDCYIEGAFYRP